MPNGLSLKVTNCMRGLFGGTERKTQARRKSDSSSMFPTFETLVGKTETPEIQALQKGSI